MLRFGRGFTVDNHSNRWVNTYCITKLVSNAYIEGKGLLIEDLKADINSKTNLWLRLR